MRPIEWNVVAERGRMVLATMRDVVEGEPLMMADFQDTHALFHEASGRWLGITRTRGVRLGKPSARMKDGIWYVEEDVKLGETVKNLRIVPKDLVLRVIR